MMAMYDRAIREIDSIIRNTKAPLSETIDALENIRDHIEPWIDALQEDLRAEENN
jgi:hypothetical protein